MNIDQTTNAIKISLGATYTIRELRGFISDDKAKSDAQAPYFDGRLLDRITRLEGVLVAAEAEAASLIV